MDKVWNHSIACGLFDDRFVCTCKEGTVEPMDYTEAARDYAEGIIPPMPFGDDSIIASQLRKAIVMSWMDGAKFALTRAKSIIASGDDEHSIRV